MKNLLNKILVLVVILGYLFGIGLHIASAARTDSVWETGTTSGYIQTTSPTGYNILVNGSNRYINFQAISGSLGYGFRDMGGILQFKDAGGSWAPFATSGGGTLTAINGDMTPAQTLSVGTGGSDFNIADTMTGTHVFNLPDASGASRGALTAADWTLFNDKLSTVAVDGISITGDGTLGSPLVALGMPTGGAIGSPVSGGNPWDVHYTDGAGNFAQNDAFTYNDSALDFAVGFSPTTTALHLNETTGSYTIGNPLTSYLDINDTGATAITTNSNFFNVRNTAASGSNLYMQLGGGFYSMGDLSATNNASQIKIDDGSRILTYSDKPHGFGTSRYLNIDPQSPAFQLGDIDNTQFGDYLDIGKDRFTFFGKPGSLRSLNFENGVDAIGDIDNANGKSTLTLDDNASSLVYQKGGQNYLNLDAAASVYQIGMIGGTYLDINDSTSVTTIQQNAALISQNNTGQQFLNLDPSTSQYSFGDLSGAGSGNKILISDGGGDITANATYGFYVSDGTNSPIVAYTFANQVYLSGNAYPNTFGTPGDVLYTDGAGTNYWSAPPVASVVAIGLPITGTSPSLALYMDSANNLAQSPNWIYNPDSGSNVFSVGVDSLNSDRHLSLNSNSGVYEIGSLSGNAGGTGTKFVISDSLQNATITANTTTAETTFGYNYIYAGWQPAGSLDMRLGDTGIQVNGTQLFIQDGIQTIQANAGFFKVADASSSVRFSIDTSTGAPTIGSGPGRYTMPSAAGSLGDVLTMGFGGTTSWNPPSTGGGMSIGNPVTASTPWEVLYTDASGNLAQDTGFTFNPTTFNFHISLNSTNIFDLSNSSGTAKLGNYSGGGVGAAYATFDWGTTGNTQFRNFGTFSVADNLGNQAFQVNTSTSLVKISNSYTLPTANTPLNGVITLTSSGVSTWSLVNTASIQTNAVTLAKIQQIAASTLMGNPTGTLNNVQAITLGTCLSFTGSVLNGTCSGSGITALTGDVTAAGTGSVAATIAANAVTYAKFQQMAANTLHGNPTGSTANSQAITLGSSLAFSTTTLNVALPSTRIAIGDGSGFMSSNANLTYGATSFNASYATNGTAITLDDTAKTAVLKAATGVSLRDAAGHHFIDVNPTATTSVILGDISGVAGGNQFQLDTTNNINTEFTTTFRVRWSGVNYLVADVNSGFYQLGDISGTTNHSYIEFNDNTQAFTVNTGGTMMFKVDANKITLTNGLVQTAITNFDYGTSNTLTSADYDVQVGAAGTGTATVILPTSTAAIGTVYIVSDYGLAAVANNIVIDSGTGNTIRATTSGQTTTIIGNGMSLTLKKVTATAWKVE